MKIRRTGREVRHLRVRKKVQGTAERPRLGIFRSEKHIYAQVIDDDEQKTLAAASTRDKQFPKDGPTSTVAAAKEVGRMLAERAKEKGVTRVVFDRGGFLYHGRVAAVAEGAREGGLEL